MAKRELTQWRGLAARASIQRPGPLSNAAQIVLVAAAYYIAARFSLRLALIQRNVTPLWPPTGIALVAILLFGRRVWPGVAVAAFLVNEPISASWVAAGATAVGNTAAPYIAAELLRAAGFRREMDRLRDAIAIVFLAALAGMLISASIGTLTLLASGAIPKRQFFTAWAVWWTGDAMGVLVVAPFLLSLLLFRRQPNVSWPRLIEAAALFVGLTALTVAVMHTALSLLFLVLPLLAWGAWRFQQRASAPAALLVAGIATWAAGHGWARFAVGTLFEKMLVLQAFNATVALTSFLLAALVTERIRSQKALEGAAAELEVRVAQRTSELSLTNERLHHEIAERREAQRRLRQRERQLAEAQQVARIGSWEWLIPEDRVTWSDEMYRIHGHEPQAFPVSFEKATMQVVPEDLERIRSNVAAALAMGRDHAPPPNQYRIVRADGVERILLGKSRLSVGADGAPARMVGTVQDITEEKHAQREHRIAETLQRSLLPERLPEIPGVELAARYVPAGGDVEVGGDWYDVVQLPNGQVAMAIGDVAGHGLRAASAMGQLRMALRAYAIEEHSPAAVISRVQHLAQRLRLSEMATIVFAVFDPDHGILTFANAGHPPPLVIAPDGTTSFVQDGLSPPLGVAIRLDHYAEAATRLPPGSTLLLFTDGLVERRGASLMAGLARLEREAAGTATSLEELCDRLLESLMEREAPDDVALLALRPVAFETGRFHLRVPAEPESLAPLRHALRRWLRELDADPRESYEILVACGEACANAIQHPYGASDGSLDIDLSLEDGEVEATVRDSGTWRSSSPEAGGRGLMLMRGLMDAVDVETGSSGTTVRMRRRLGAKAGGRTRTP